MIKGVIKFLVISGVSLGLMSVVVSSKAKSNPLSKPHKQNQIVFGPDSPGVSKDDLHFKFNDNNGTQPIYDDKSGLYLQNPSNSWRKHLKVLKDTLKYVKISITTCDSDNNFFNA